MFRSRTAWVPLAIVIVALSSTIVLIAQSRVWQPSAGHVQVPLWPGVPPGATSIQEREVAGTVVDDDTGQAKPVGGKPWTYVNYVSRPTLTVYSLPRPNTGAAVLVFPGGGYNVLAIDLEGTEACDWLTAKGITCVLVKYRVPCAKIGPYRECPPALQDAQRALSVVRHRAVEWQLNPRQIGVLGFSAGGHIVAALSTHFAQRVYPSVDAADRESRRPDFAIALYPGHIVASAANSTMNPDLRVTAQTPPTMIVAASDDPTDPVQNSIVYGAALKKAGVPFELHIFATGGTVSAFDRWTALPRDGRHWRSGGCRRSAC